MADDWVDVPDDVEVADGEQPVGSDDDVDESGYDPGDDPGTRAPEFTAEPPRSPDRGPLPISPAAIPGWVKSFANGHIPMDKMLKVAPLSTGYLVQEAAAAWRNLQNSAQQAGIVLTMTGAYRSYDQQVWLFNDRYVTSDTGRSSKTWNGTKYWLKPGKEMAAVPGTSNHGWGCAVDCALNAYGNGAKTVDDRFVAWARQAALANGWSWEVQSEPWHLRLVKPSAVPQAAAGGPPPTLQTAPTPTLQLKSSGAQVAALQHFCMRFKWGDCGSADGNFGPRTEAAVKAMQSALNVTADGQYGPKSAAALDAFLKSAPAAPA